ncbi:uncharacterized protein LOC128861566 isoform X2 [Anastrepha ludens]|uniref:uncharacterized protein LOC128861566 isoform X2 n=1 Tax=Anastrepha ludens TaxID=28586 RepID=UPI0023AFDB2B|nr:uncharacterized protein LOC128861566 isoform X2 [Anastrepha ludens]
MMWNDLCFKLYFWPFLNYLAGLKGICPFYIASTTTSTTTTTTTTTTTAGPPTVPTFSPTPPTFSPTAPTVTTMQPCPDQPLACLNGNVSPIPNCPCIDPRLSGMVGMMGAPGMTMTPLLARSGPASSEFQNAGELSDRLTFMPINTQANAPPNLQPKASGYFNFANRAQSGATTNAPNLYGPVPMGSDMMVFSSLNGRRRRKRRK